jgi:hypothetical protein
LRAWSILANLPNDDFAGKAGLNSRRTYLADELARLVDSEDNLASTAPMFGGQPVIGSRGIDSEFAAKTLSNYKDMVNVLWATTDNQDVKARGPIPGRTAAALYVTEMVRGSVGFLIEEVDSQGNVLFPSALKLATDRATEIIQAFTSEDETEFDRELSKLSQRVFTSLRSFFTGLHRAEATMRIVEGRRDLHLDKSALARAFVRIEESAITEDDVQFTGTLLGVLPEAGRFEFRSQAGVLLSGKVAESFAESYLKRLRDEQVVGRLWNASFRRKETILFGKKTDSYTLFDLREAVGELVNSER